MIFITNKLNVNNLPEGVDFSTTPITENTIKYINKNEMEVSIASASIIFECEVFKRFNNIKRIKSFKASKDDTILIMNRSSNCNYEFNNIVFE